MTTDLAITRRETQALRLLRDGYSIGQAADRTGLPKDRVTALARDFPTNPPTAAAGTRELPVRLLDPHPANVRSHIGDITELAASILEQGILQPLLVTTGKPGRYTVIAGHRRLAAAKQAGLATVPAVIRPGLTSTDALEAMLVENLQRADLNPIEEAQAYQALVNQGRTLANIARAVGKSDYHVSRRLDLLHLTDEEQQLVIRKELTLDKAGQIARSRLAPRTGAGVPRPKPYRVPYFTRTHPLAADARQLCDRAGHGITTRIGPACGSCWEQVIRASERATARPAAATGELS